MAAADYGASIALLELIAATAWERAEWHGWLVKRGDAILSTSMGPNASDGFRTVGDLTLHIFIAEKHHVDRLARREITDASSISTGSIEALFGFGRRSRRDLEEFVSRESDEDWNVPREFDILDNVIRVSPRKFITHILLHEIRHWAQIATALRQAGAPASFPDFLVSPVMGGGLQIQKK